MPYTYWCGRLSSILDNLKEKRKHDSLAEMNHTLDDDRSLAAIAGAEEVMQFEAMRMIERSTATIEALRSARKFRHEYARKTRQLFLIQGYPLIAESPPRKLLSGVPRTPRNASIDIGSPISETGEGLLEEGRSRKSASGGSRRPSLIERIKRIGHRTPSDGLT
jgi:hypothetical protein